MGHPEEDIAIRYDLYLVKFCFEILVCLTWVEHVWAAVQRLREMWVGDIQRTKKSVSKLIFKINSPPSPLSS